MKKIVISLFGLLALWVLLCYFWKGVTSVSYHFYCDSWLIETKKYVCGIPYTTRQETLQNLKKNAEKINLKVEGGNFDYAIQTLPNESRVGNNTLLKVGLLELDSTLGTIKNQIIINDYLSKLNIFLREHNGEAVRNLADNLIKEVK